MNQPPPNAPYTEEIERPLVPSVPPPNAPRILSPEDVTVTVNGVEIPAMDESDDAVSACDLAGEVDSE